MCTTGLHYPMMACVDYKGYRVLAMAALPIDKVESTFSQFYYFTILRIILFLIFVEVFKTEIKFSYK